MFNDEMIIHFMNKIEDIEAIIERVIWEKMLQLKVIAEEIVSTKL